MLKSLFTITLFLSLTFLMITCSKSNSGGSGSAIPGYCDGVISKYTADVQPIIAAGCLLGSNCHSAGSTNTGGELTDYNKVYNKRAAIKDAVFSGTMPQTGTLSADQKKKIICWIDSGAPNN
jgi:hypothetical protein